MGGPGRQNTVPYIVLAALYRLLTGVLFPCIYVFIIPDCCSFMGQFVVNVAFWLYKFTRCKGQVKN